MRVHARTAALLLAGIVLACSAQVAPAPDPTTVLRQSGQALGALHSVTADVKFGQGIVLEGLTLSSATAKVQLPGQSDAVFKVKQGDFLVDVRVVTTGGHVFLRLPFSQLTEISPEDAKSIPDLSKLFDQQAGLPALLPAGKGTKYQNAEQVSGVDSDKVTTTYTADQIGQLLSGAAKPAGDVQATIWSGRGDHLVRRVILNGPLLEAGKDVQVQVDLHDFNKPVTITTPSPSPSAA